MSDIASIPVAQMREAAQAWRKHGLSMSAHDRIDDFIAEIERLRAARDADVSRAYEVGVRDGKAAMEAEIKRLSALSQNSVLAALENLDRRVATLEQR